MTKKVKLNLVKEEAEYRIKFNIPTTIVSFIKYFPLSIQAELMQVRHYYTLSNYTLEQVLEKETLGSALAYLLFNSFTWAQDEAERGTVHWMYIYRKLKQSESLNDNFKYII